MVVSVVYVGPVPMRVRHRLVRVPVCMAPGDQTRVFVLVMSVIMGVFVLVLQLFVGVLVTVLLPREQDYGGHEEERRDEVHDGERFSEKDDREADAEEGGAGKYDLCARRPYSLSRRNIQDDAGPVGEHPHDERRRHDGRGSL